MGTMQDWRAAHDKARPHGRNTWCDWDPSCWWCHVEDPDLLDLLDVTGSSMGRRVCGALSRDHVRSVDDLRRLTWLDRPDGPISGGLDDVRGIGSAGAAYVWEKLGTTPRSAFPQS